VNYDFMKTDVQHKAFGIYIKESIL